jgi:hypothetical protein
MGKVIGRFDRTPTLLSYYTDRVVAQADVNGGRSQRPRAWRRLEDPAA